MLSVLLYQVQERKGDVVRIGGEDIACDTANLLGFLRFPSAGRKVPQCPQSTFTDDPVCCVVDQGNDPPISPVSSAIGLNDRV